MGVIAKNKNKITLYYSSENSIGKQTYAYVTPSDGYTMGRNRIESRYSHWGTYRPRTHRFY